ncbi:hypothetical protein CMT52_05175 [Elizabethkingia anophelis]|nr:hypothetical protein [Elizabethkingia anophelis]MDV4023725.1 hypothetical protein [Elizabethkingia anophelis]
MKNYVTVLLLAGATLSIVSCDRNNDDQDTIGQEYKMSGDFTYDANFGYYISGSFDKVIPSSDRVLVFMWNGTDNGADVWSPVPNTTYVDDSTVPNGRKIYYSYAFSVKDVYFYAKGNYDISTTPSYLKNQRFSLLVVPANSIKTSASVNEANYRDVIKKYNLNSSNIININVKN